ncbi:MAG: tetratricopeptide repeat protein [Bacteroidia bacterium]|nr:tetratricopeptide repeat protein [Bacteroidia bacterium]
MKRMLTILITVFLYMGLCGQRVEKIIQSGNEFYKKQQYLEAVSEYNKALAIDSSNTTAMFNLGNSMYKKNSRDEAIKAYTDLAAKAKGAGLSSDSYYNTGVVLGKQQKLEESIEAYKNALRQNPDNIEARENLQKSLMELKKRNEKKQEPENKKQNKKQDQRQQSKMSPKEAQQRLKLMAQKEKQVQERLQKEKSKSGGNQTKDW